MQVTMERLEGDEVKLSIRAEAPEVDDAVALAYRRLAAQYNIPGFRRGKAPRPVLERFIGRETLLTQAQTDLNERLYREAVAQEHLHPYDAPQLEPLPLAEHEAYDLSLTVRVLPPVTLGPYRDIEVAVDVEGVLSSMVESALRELQVQHARLVPVDEVAAASHVAVDGVFRNVGAQEIIEERNDMQLDLSPQGGVAPEIAEGLQGARVDEVRTVRFSSTDERGQSTDVEGTFTVRAIHTVEVPPVDDDLAAEVGPYASLQELVETLAKSLAERAAQEAVERRREEVVARVVQGSTVQVPDVLVERQLDRLVEEMRADLARQETTLERYLTATGLDMGQLRERLRESALYRVKRSVVLGAIAEAEGVRVLPEELRRAARSLGGVKALPESALAGLEQIILEQRVIDRIVTDAVVVPAVAGEAEASSEPS